MINLIDIEDFKAGTALATDQFTIERLDKFISENQDDLMYRLFGVELANLIYSDMVNGVPQNSIYTKIFEPFARDVATGDCGCESKQLISKGVKFYLASRIFFLYVREFGAERGLESLVQRKNTNADNTFLAGNFLKQEYNHAIDTGRAIQEYIEKNKSTYPKYSGVCLDYIVI